MSNVAESEQTEKAYATAIVQRVRRARSRRSSWEQLWQDIADRVFPRYGSSFNGARVAAGTKRTDKMLDTTAGQGLLRFGAALEYMLTPRTQTWHRLRASDPGLNKSRRVQEWFHTVNGILFQQRYSPRANFASVQAESYLSLGAFGVGSYLVDGPAEDHLKGLRYKGLALADVYFEQNFQGIIDTAFRFFKLSARQAVQQFGREKLPANIEAVIKQSEEKPGSTDVDNEQFEFVHLIEPRRDYNKERADAKGMPFKSCYASVDDPTILSEGGYTTFPIPINRDVTLPGEVYAYSPASWALGNIKTLNEQKRVMLKQGQRAVDPILLAADDGIVDAFNLEPGSINAGGVNAQGQPLVRRLDDGANVALGFEMMDIERKAINDFFLVNIFQILTDTPQMTATEVMERVREKGALLTPTMGRQQSEGLGPLIEREIDVLSRQGMLPPPPGELVEADGDFQIEYDSPLARAQKAEEAAGFSRLMEVTTMYAQATGDQSVFDRINFDAAVPDLAWTYAVPPHYINDDATVQQKRDGRQQQQGVETAIQAAPAVAGLMKAAQPTGKPKA